MNKSEFIEHLKEIYRKRGLDRSSIEDLVKDKLKALEGFTISELKEIEEERRKEIRKLPTIISKKPIKNDYVNESKELQSERREKWIKNEEKKELNKFKQYDGILIIPIKKDEPILVFKMLGKPFYHTQLELCPDRDDTFEWEPFDYWIYWKGFHFKNKYPVVIKEQYDEDFWYLLHSETVYYNNNAFPKNVIELPISVVKDNSKMRIFSSKYITPVRDALRKLDLLEEVRGKLKKNDKSKKERDRKIIKLYKEIVAKTKKKRPYPIKSIFHKLEDYEISFATIRRVLDSCTKK